MTLIYSHPYVTVSREIKNNQQNITESIHYIRLYPSKISCHTHQFHIDDVLDISYKLVSRGHWMLYLHTTQGSFAFNCKKTPDSLIEHFKKLK